MLNLLSNLDNAIIFLNNQLGSRDYFSLLPLLSINLKEKKSRLK